MPRIRDSQRSKVYRAERKAFKENPGREFKTIPEIEDFVYGIMKKGWFRKRFPFKTTARIKDGRGRSRYAGGWRTGDGVGMTLPKFARIEWIVLHEICHGLQPRPSAAHGWEFCDIYLWLVRKVMKREAHDRLKAEFKTGRVRFRTKRTCILTEEQKAILRERMARARQIKLERKLNEPSPPRPSRSSNYL